MSVKRYAAKRDGNEAAIVAALRECGATVHQISAKGLPDLLVGWQGRTILCEVKTKSGKLTDDQQTFISTWCGGEVWVIRTVKAALEMLSSSDELPL